MDNSLSPNLNNKAMQEEPINRQRVFWASIIFTSVALISFVFSFFLISRSPVWQAYVISAITAIALAVDVFAVVLTLRGQLEKGLKYLFWSTLFTVPPNVLLVTNTTPILITMVLAVGGIHLFYLQPKSWRKQYQFAPVVASVLMALVEVLQPTFRLDVTGASTGTSSNYFGPFILAFLIISLIALIVRQTWGGSMRSKLLTVLIGSVIVSTVALGIPVGTETQRFFRENLEREFTALTTNRATQLGDLLDQQINALTTLTLNEGIQKSLITKNLSYQGDDAAIQATLDERDALWRAADEANNNADPLVQTNLNSSIARELSVYQQVFPDNVEVFVTDVYGGLVGTTNRTSDYYQADEGWWQSAYNNGQGAVYISEPEYDQSADAIGVQIALPIHNSNSGEIIGVLRTTYLLTPLAAILSEKIGETGEMDLFFPGEVISHIHEGNLEQADPEEFAALQAVADQGMVDMEYEGAFSVVTQAPIQTLSGNSTINNLGWLVVFHQHQDEALLQVTGTMQGILLVALIILVVAILAAFFIARVLVNPITKLTTIAEAVAAGDLNSRADATSADEIGTLATTFNTMTSRLQETLGSLEQRVAARTRNLELAAEVGRTVSQVQKLDVMLKDASELILKEFNLYYVQVYLTDPSQTNLVLEAGTGDVGAQLLARAHSLPFNTASINGRAAVEQKSVVISDTTQSATFKRNPLLPETRGEMAVPLIVGNRVVGVLDMQSSQPGVLTEEVLPAFEALAGQMAVAVQNANLLAETEEARAEVEKQARRLVREGWDEHLDAIHKPEYLGYVFAQNSVTPLAFGDEAPISDNKKTVSAPLSVTGQALGSLVVEMDNEARAEQTTELVNIVARQVAQQIENLRLLESSERYRAEAEKAARLQTVEGWQQYISSRAGNDLGYMYDSKEVRPKNGSGAVDGSMFALPLKVRDEQIGNISVQGLTKENQEELELANVVAERLSEHIESLRLFEETKQGQVELTKRARQLSAVAEISTASSQELEVDKLLSTVVKLTQRQFDLYHAHIFIFDEVAQELKIAACGWQEGNEHEGTTEIVSIPLDKKQSLVARAARTKKAVIVNDVKGEPGWLANELLPNTAAEMAVPLVIGDRVLGVLDVQADRVNAFTDEDANIQTTLASQVATAMQNARSFTLAQKQAERESMLNTINQKIQSATSVEAVLQIAARELGHALGAPMAVAQLSMKDKS